jgi:hypothetical protein
MMFVFLTTLYRHNTVVRDDATALELERLALFFQVFP